ncbi:MAG: isopeptide-forming domain-containing fimbrial protein [Bilifractor sp.]
MEYGTFFKRVSKKAAIAIFGAALAISPAAAYLPMAGMTVAQADTNYTGTISVSGIQEANATIKAYQIVEPVYSNGQLTGYQLNPTLTAGGCTIADTKNFAPTAAEIAAIATYINDHSNEFTAYYITDKSESDTTTYQKTGVPIGEYLVLVSGDGEYVYNPAVVSASLTDANEGTVENGTVNMKTVFSDTNNAYVKSTKPTMDKKITGSHTGSTEEATAGDLHDEVFTGKYVDFKIDNLVIPSYSDEYKDITYTVTDTLEEGAFDNLTTPVVTLLKTNNSGDGVQRLPVSSDTGEYTLTKGNHDFTISFSENFIRNNGNQKLEITYSARLTKNAGVNFDENINHAELTYTNNPNKSTTKIKKNTYHYTFAIDANINGSEDGESYELNKVTKTYEKTDEYSDGTSSYPLAGAQFTLYTDPGFDHTVVNANMEHGTATSDANGHISFKGLDEGTYYLKETMAPTVGNVKYSLSEKEYRIVIGNTHYENDGALQSYSINIYDVTGLDTPQKSDGGTRIGGSTFSAPTDSAGHKVDESTGEITYTNTKDGTSTITKTIDPAEIVNTELSGLPSTGGRGTIILTIVAACGMAIFLTVFLNSRKKEQA